MNSNMASFRWLQAAAIILAGAWVFSPAIRGDWVWDDQAEVAQNSVLHDPAGLRKIWLAPDGADYFPLKTTVQWFEWHLWQDSRLGYHLASVCLHLLSALLLWRLLEKLGVRLPWLGGFIFAIHPLTVESVAWVAELKNTLSLPLLLLAMNAYVDFDRRGRRRDRLLAIVWYLASLLAKTSGAMFPVVLLLYCWWRRGRITWRDVRGSAPFLAISLGLGAVTVWFQVHRAIAGAELELGGFLPRLASAGLALAFYFGKCVVPIGLMPVYPRWQVIPPSPLQFLPWLGLAGVVACLWSRRATWGRHALFGLGCFVANLVPVLGFIPMAYLRFSPVADHLAYLPLVALAGLAAAGAGALYDRLARAGRELRVVSLGIGAVLCGLLAVSSHGYARIFAGDEAFWTFGVRQNPDAWVGHNDLGRILAATGRSAQARDQFKEGTAAEAWDGCRACEFGGCADAAWEGAGGAWGV
jgi:protein O-mannosyl-transferase